MPRALRALFCVVLFAAASRAEPQDPLADTQAELLDALEDSRRALLEDASWELDEPDAPFSALGGAEAVSPAVHGPLPFPALAGRDLRLAVKALADGKTAAARGSACDLALASFGVPSLADALDGYRLEGPDANIFDGRRSTLKPRNWRRTVGAEFRSEDNSAGAKVLSRFATGSRMVTFLGPYFFDPHGRFIDEQRMIIVAHEAVHQTGGKGDAAFGGSRMLSHMIVDKCFPRGRGRLGGID